MQIPLTEARAGDILAFKRRGILSWCLSWLVKWFREPNWNRDVWHMEPVIDRDGSAIFTINAKFPKSVLQKRSVYDEGFICYRVLNEIPSVKDIYEFTADHQDKPYDCLVYLWTGLWAIHIPIPRIINGWYMCWEMAFDLLEYCGCDLDRSDRKYPFITDFLRYVGELK